MLKFCSNRRVKYGHFSRCSLKLTLRHCPCFPHQFPHWDWLHMVLSLKRNRYFIYSHISILKHIIHSRFKRLPRKGLRFKWQINKYFSWHRISVTHQRKDGEESTPGFGEESKGSAAKISWWSTLSNGRSWLDLVSRYTEIMKERSQYVKIVVIYKRDRERMYITN